MGLFVKQDFISNAGLPLHWKIECDALTEGDWAALAQIASEVLPPFAGVWPIPRGGIPFGDALMEHVTRGAKCSLIVDDVLTTGGSMEREWVARLADGTPQQIIGVVAFSRAPREQVADWITPLFQIASRKQS